MRKVGQVLRREVGLSFPGQTPLDFASALGELLKARTQAGFDALVSNG